MRGIVAQSSTVQGEEVNGFIRWIRVFGFCQNSELANWSGRPKYGLDHDIHAANSVIRVDRICHQQKSVV